MFIIEIIALIFLCKRNGDLALQKGLKARTWKIYTVVAWLCAECIGGILGLLIFGLPAITNLADMPQSVIAEISMVALFAAFGGYLFVRFTLERKPANDELDNDVNHIGVDDLRPPPKK
jgi:hypothetical protein